jgi:hypothetical protein
MNRRILPRDSMMSSAYSRQSRVLGDIYRLALHHGAQPALPATKPNDFRCLRHAHICRFTMPICRTFGMCRWRHPSRNERPCLGQVS